MYTVYVYVDRSTVGIDLFCYLLSVFCITDLYSYYLSVFFYSLFVVFFLLFIICILYYYLLYGDSELMLDSYRHMNLGLYMNICFVAFII